MTVEVCTDNERIGEDIKLFYDALVRDDEFFVGAAAPAGEYAARYGVWEPAQTIKKSVPRGTDFLLFYHFTPRGKYGPQPSAQRIQPIAGHRAERDKKQIINVRAARQEQLT